jgi:hypothetical protein
LIMIQVQFRYYSYSSGCVHAMTDRSGKEQGTDSERASVTVTVTVVSSLTRRRKTFSKESSRFS